MSALLLLMPQVMLLVTVGTKRCAPSNLCLGGLHLQPRHLHAPYSNTYVQTQNGDFKVSH